MTEFESIGDPAAGVVKPPKALLIAGALASFSSVILHLPGERWANALGYLLGTFVSIFLVAFYRREDARRSASSRYSPEPTQAPIATGILIVGILSALPHVFHLAESAPI